MRTLAFRDWLAKAEELTPAQRQQAIAGLRPERRSAPDPLAVVLDASRACPHCHHRVCRRWGQAHGLPRFRCAACGHTFNALTGTPLARLRHREGWGEYAQALIDGRSVRAAARRCGVHKNTAFRWRHRFLALPAGGKPSHLHGIVEADEFLPVSPSCRGSAPARTLFEDSTMPKHRLAAVILGVLFLSGALAAVSRSVAGELRAL
jgi:transposase-like protein